MAPTTELDIVFGAMTFGKEGIEQVRTSSLPDCAAILSTFQSHSHSSIDTSRFYGNGTSESYLGALNWQDRNLSIHTKFYPNTQGYLGRAPTHLTLPDMRNGLEESLAALQCDSVELWYLHAPDRSVALEETVSAVQVLYKEGKFKRWGISNFMAWEVAAICEICLRHQTAGEEWLLPSVYQGVYNAFHRTIEAELLPCLRKYGIAFYAFNPLAGGYLTDRYRRDTKDSEIESGTRFDPQRFVGKAYRARYWNEEFFKALEGLREVAGQEGLRESECALRWLMHHSALKREFGDRVIIGASSEEQLEMNLRDLEGKKLSEGVVRALDEGWKGTRGLTWKYWH